MPTSSKTQPWKIAWPPVKVASDTTSHGCPVGAPLYVHGDTVSKPQVIQPVPVLKQADEKDMSSATENPQLL